LILKRENYRCFYTLEKLDEKNFVIDHVVSRPNGDNSYRNVVAASREANNRKGSTAADDFLRRLFRDGFLTASEMEERLLQLGRLKAGELKPPLNLGV
jgi:5-methylcytosine-specific restriction endonuclease McrA